MSRFRVCVASVVMLLLAILMVEAQPAPPKDRGFSEFQIDMITQQLYLDDSKVEPFTTLYTEYINKMKELQPKAPKRGGQHPPQAQNAERPPKLTAEEIETRILKSFDLAEQSNALKREYYYKFKEILTPQQILKMYNMERRLRERMLSESARRNQEGQKSTAPQR